MSDETRDEQRGGFDPNAAAQDAREAAAEQEPETAQDEAIEERATPGEGPTHSDESAPATTRDGLDAGVPMQEGSPEEPVGPEDALGVGEKRGDYRERVSGVHQEGVPTEDGGEPVLDDDGNVVDYKPKAKLVNQTARVDEIGDVAGKKGGVETAPSA